MFASEAKASAVMAEEVPDPTALIERYKEEVKEEITAGYAKELFGTIIGFSLSGSRRALMEKYEKEASTACERHAPPHACTRARALRVRPSARSDRVP